MEQSVDVLFLKNVQLGFVYILLAYNFNDRCRIYLFIFIYYNFPTMLRAKS